VDRFTSIQDQNDHRSILHYIFEHMSQAEMLLFVTFVCNCRGGRMW